MNKQAVRFENANGEVLVGDVYWPLNPPRAFALFAHCFTCSANSKAAVSIARAMNQQGFAVLSFDFTGLGRSEGDFSDTNFSSNVSDLLAAVRFLEDDYEAPEILVGHSLGGTAVLASVGNVPSCRAVVSIGAPARAAHVAHLLDGERDEIQTSGEAIVKIGERPFRIKKQFLDDIEQQDVPENLRRLRCALLVMHAPLDAMVAVDNATEIFQYALHPKSFVSLDDADHLLTRARDALYAGTVIGAWASRYVDPPKTDARLTAEQQDMVAARTGKEGFVTEINAGRHALIADEPVAVGGSDRGTSPYGLLAAALASCTTITLQMYARRKGIALEEAVARVRHSKIHAVDCEECETRTGKVDRFTRQLEFVGELTSAQTKRLIEIADRCPVHRTLSSEVSIVTSLADDD